MDGFDAIALILFSVGSVVLAATVPKRERRDRYWWTVFVALIFVVVSGLVIARVNDWRPFETLLRALRLDGWWTTSEVRPWLDDALDQAGIRDTLVRIAQVLNQSLNLSLLYLFLLVRALLGPVGAGLTRGAASWSPARVFYVPIGEGRVELAGHWYYSRVLFGVLAIVATVLAALQTAGVTARLPLGFGTGWPMLSMLLLVTIALFLRGTLQSAASHADELASRTPEDDAATDPLAAIRADTRNTWKEWLLVEAEVEGDRGARPPAQGASARMERALDVIRRGRSVFLEDVLPFRATEAVEALLRRHAASGQTVLVLVDEADQLASVSRWIDERSRSANHPRRPVTDRYGAVTGPLPPLAVVATLRDPLLRALDRELFPRGRPGSFTFDAVIVLDAHATALWHAAEFRALVSAISDDRGRAPQLLALGEWRVNSEGAIRNIAGLNVTKVQFGRSPDRAWALAWRTESPSSRPDTSFFQQAFNRGDINAYVSPELVLVLPPLKRAWRETVIVGQARLPWLVMRQEADNAIEKGQVDAHFERIQLDDDVAPIATDWEVPPPGGSDGIVIARDVGRNVVNAVSKWYGYANRTLVQVVSPPYLFRDFFADQLSDRLNEPRAFSALAPGRFSDSVSPWEIAYDLFRRLQRGPLDVVRIERALDDAHGTAGSVEGVGPLTSRLAAFLEDQLGLMRPTFATERSTRFDPETSEFVRETRLRLPAAVIEPPWHRVVHVVGPEFEGQESVKLGTYHAGSLHQRFLPGQVHVFGGRTYRIGAPKDGNMRANFVDSVEYVETYRQIRRFDVDWPNARVLDRIANLAGSDRVRLRADRLDVPVKVATPGYFAFVPRAGLDVPKSRFFNLAAEGWNVDALTRKYRHGKVLRAQFVQDGVHEDAARLEPTLALLLNEALATYLPEAWPFVRALAPDRSAGGAMDVSAVSVEDSEGFLSYWVPSVRVAPDASDDESSGTMTIFFVEDAYFELGILAALQTKLDDIVADLVSYLDWYMSGGAARSSFLNFGFDECPPGIELEALADFLQPFQRLGPSGESARHRVQRTTLEKGRFRHDRVKACDFCGRWMDSVDLNLLEDGRHWCGDCEQAAVTSLDDVRRLYRQARSFMEERYGVAFPEGITIEFVDPPDIAEAQEREHVVTAGFDERAVGLARSAERAVLVENGWSELQTLGTIVHELVHIWQFDVLPSGFFDDRELVEGAAVWCEIDYREHHGFPDLERWRAAYEARDDEYGRGYKRLLRDMQATGAISPFEWMRDTFIPDDEDDEVDLRR
ncbi:MAG: hypothetical protein LC667_11785 [Thioalkalivibrio sp.]|nr:hypothetical protein [Thioalkalivibrio sp.]